MFRNRVVNIRMAAVCLLIGCAAIPATLAVPLTGGDPAEVFALGEARLQEGDFAGALKAFTEAARLAPDNEAYRQQAGLVRRVIKLREDLNQVEDAEKWTTMATSLHVFYHRHKLFTEALELDQRIHARLNNASSAAMLARTQLALRMDPAAASLLRQLDAERVTPEVKALLGIALARQGKLDEAKALAQAIGLPKDATAGLFFEVACLRGVIADEKGALELLKRSFELTPPSRLPAARIAATESPDLVALTGSEAFAAVLKTESRVNESGDSGGTGCGKCPRRSSCRGESQDNEKAGEKPCKDRDKGEKAEKP